MPLSVTDPYVLVIVLALVLATGVDVLVSLLTLRRLVPAPPPEFADVFDTKEYARSQTYIRSKVRLGLVEEVTGLAVLLTFLLAGGLAWVDGLAAGLVEMLPWSWESSVARGLAFIGILALAGDLLTLPFSVYHTFVLEERFGFNRSTPRTFVLDRLKGLTLGALLGGPLLGAVLWFLEAAGDVGWLYAWAVAVFFMLLVQFLAPTVLLPLFNKFTPLEEGELRQRINEYMQRVHFDIKGVYVMDGSRRSTKANAFFTGFGSTRRIALFDTLLQRHPHDEILAVLAHEVGHYKHRHVLKLLALGILKTGALLYLLSLLLQAEGLFAAFRLEPSVHAGLLLFGLLFSPLSLLLSAPVNWLSRRFERQADSFALRTLGTGAPLADALKRLASHALANLTPHPLDVALHYSHPPVLERVRRLQNLNATEGVHNRTMTP